MSTKGIFVFCAQAFLIQSAFSQCASSGNYGSKLSGYGWGAPTAAVTGSDLACGSSLGYGYGAGGGNGAGQGFNNLAITFIPTSGGGLPVSSVSAIAPSGLSLTSENVFEGTLCVTGELPFLSAIALDALLASGGAGIVNYSAGNGVNSIESIGTIAAYAPVNAAISSAAYAPGMSAVAPAVAGIAPGVRYGSVGGQGCRCSMY